MQVRPEEIDMIEAASSVPLIGAALIRRIESDAVPWLPYQFFEGSFTRVLQVDETNNIVILNQIMGANTVYPRHGHFCTAMAYTLSGAWYYDELVFRHGDVAFETTVEVHQPYTLDEPAELLTVLMGRPEDDRLLEDFLPDGTRLVFRTSFFKALERITPEQAARLDFVALTKEA